MHLWDDEGARIGQVFVFVNETGKYFSTEAIKMEMGKDHVTGLLNRQAFTANLHRELNSQEQHKHTATLFHINLDQFRLINDTCGRPRKYHICFIVLANAFR